MDDYNLIMKINYKKIVANQLKMMSQVDPNELGGLDLNLNSSLVYL